MCHCRPNVRTPCCGPECCKVEGGCGFCRPKVRREVPAAEPMTSVATTLLQAGGPARPSLRWTRHHARLFHANSADGKVTASVMFDDERVVWRCTATSTTHTEGEWEKSFYFRDLRDGRIEAMLACEDAIERYTLLTGAP